VAFFCLRYLALPALFSSFGPDFNRLLGRMLRLVED